MSAFTVTPLRCDHCGGAGEVSVEADPQAPTRSCRECGGSGVGGWEVREPAVVCADHRLGITAAGAREFPGEGAPCVCEPGALIGVLPNRGTLDREAAETFAACLETVPGREVEALEHFAETEVYPDFLIEALGATLTGEAIPERPRAGVRS